MKDITLRINSVGGDVFEAQAMYSYLKSHPANVTVRVDGIAASAASLVAMAGDRIIMPANALMMIHNPAGFAMGEAEDMRDMADILDKVRDSIAAVYMMRTAIAREDILRMMDEETWMTAEEAHVLGFCDEVEGAIEIAAMALKDGGLSFRSCAGSAILPPDLGEKLPASKLSTPPIRALNNPSPPRPPSPARGEGGDETLNIKEEDHMEITNVAELEKAFPAFVDEIRKAAFQEGVNAERERLRMLDSLAGPERESILAKAKYEEPRDARDVAIELLQADRNASALAARFDDAGAVNAALQPQVHPNDRDREEALTDAIANNINQMRGYAR